MFPIAVLEPFSWPLRVASSNSLQVAYYKSLLHFLYYSHVVGFSLSVVICSFVIFSVFVLDFAEFSSLDERGSR